MSAFLYLWCDACQKTTEHERLGTKKALLRCKRCDRKRSERNDAKVPNVIGIGKR